MSDIITSIPLPKHPLFKDLTGQKFGRLLVQKYAGRKNNRTVWGCLCDCGSNVVVAAVYLLLGDTTSCGCYQREMRATTHLKHGNQRRGRRTAEYATWSRMLHRCTNPNNADFDRYGGRGITVCERWRSFENFLADMGPRPSPKHTIDRKDNNGNYERDNCRWATQKEQANNRSSSKLVTYDGQTKTVAEWAKALGFNYNNFCRSLKRGKTIDEAIAYYAIRLRSTNRRSKA